MLAGRLRIGAVVSQPMTFAVIFRVMDRDTGVPPSLRAPVAVTVTVPFAAPVVAELTVMRVLVVSLTALLPRLTQFDGRVTEAGVVAVIFVLVELTLKLTTAPSANT